MSAYLQTPEAVSMSALSLALIGPDHQRRQSLVKFFATSQANVVKEVGEYPDADGVQEIAEAGYDVIVVDLDGDLERALDVVENLCAAAAPATVMAHARHCEAELLMRCMRAGAREFLSDPLQQNMVAEALIRAEARRDEVRRSKKTSGKLLVFASAKGGSGVTTLASNVAVALAHQGSGSVALIDLDLQLGDAALGLGLGVKFSVADALGSADRLDSDLLLALMSKHSSGLLVLAATETIPVVQASRNDIEKLLRLARENFAYVVIDTGSPSIEMYHVLFEAATTVYLVTQVGVPELRNANRFIARYFSGAASEKLEVVLNRYISRNAEIDEAAITKALTRTAKWKVPNDYAATRKAQNTGISLVGESNQIARALTAIAVAAAGRAPVVEKKKRFGIFG